MNHPRVSIIIVNWNGKKYLEECLTAVFNQTYPNYEVILVDNGSTDGSAEYVETNFPQAKVIRLDKNYGFSKGNNVGIQEAFKDLGVKYIATLNNDTKVEPPWLEESIKVAELHTQAGSIAPKILFYHDHNLIDCVGICIYPDCSATNRGFFEEDNNQYDEVEEVFGPSAAAALYRREVLEKVGLFDEDYFAYYEDVDLAWRCRLAGWKSLYVPSSVVYHVHSASSTGSYRLRLYGFAERNRVWNIIKLLPVHMIIASIWYSGLRYFLILYCSLLYRIGARRRVTVDSFKKGPIWERLPVFIQAYLDVFKSPRSLFRKRKEVQAIKKVKNSEIKSWFRKFGIDVKKLVLG